MLIWQDQLLHQKYQETVAPEWNTRDFVPQIQTYINGQSEKVLALLGLRGTGKTVGILQALMQEDFLYIRAQRNEKENNNDYKELILNTDKRIIVLDEYSWIDGYEELAGTLVTLVENGKRVIIAGTESLGIEKLRFGNLIHRVTYIHTNYFSLQEYMRLFGYTELTHRVVDKYLTEGGVFPEYIVDNTTSLDFYLRNALFDSLSKHIPYVSENTCRAIVYNVFYNAIYQFISKEDSLDLDRNIISLDEYFSIFGINTDEKYTPAEFNNVVSVLKDIDVIITIPNLADEQEHQTVIVNPTIAYLLIKTIFPNEKVPGTYLGPIYESMCICEKYFNKSSQDGIYYYLRNQGSQNKQMDIIVLDEKKRHEGCFVFECKHGENYKITGRESFMSDILEEMFPDGIVTRYIQYNGKPNIVQCNNKEIIFISPEMSRMDYTNVESVKSYVLDYKEKIRHYIEQEIYY